jgi:hypothetical protein
MMVIILTATLGGPGSVRATDGLDDADAQKFAAAPWHMKLSTLIDRLAPAAATPNGQVMHLAESNLVNRDLAALPGNDNARLSDAQHILADQGADGLKPHTAANLYAGDLPGNLAAVQVAATRDANRPNGAGQVVATDHGRPSRVTLLAAAAVASAAGKQLVIGPGTWEIDSDVTISSAVRVEKGATLSVATTKTLTLNGAFEAGLFPVFSCVGTGQVSFAPGTVTEVQCGWFGNNTSAITAALHATPTGATLRFNAGQSYIFSPSSTITIKGKSIYLTCDPGVEIDASGATTSPIINIMGKADTYYKLPGTTYLKGALSIRVNPTLASSLSSGDLIFISTDPSKGGSGSDTWNGLNDIYKGEFIEVRSVSGSTVNLMNPLLDDYIADNTVAAKISTITGGLKNFKARGSSLASSALFTIRYARNYEINNSHLSNFGTSGAIFYFSYNVKVNNISSSGYFASRGTGMPLDFATCQTVSISNSKLMGGFQALNCGGANPGLEPTRNVFIGPGNTIINNVDESKRAVCKHSNVEQVRIFGNTLYGGVDLGTFNESLEDNDIYMVKANIEPVLVWHRYYNSDYTIIKNNRFHCPDSMIGASSVLVLVSGGNGTTLGLFEFDGNTFNGKAGVVELHCDQDNKTSFSIRHAKISNNTGKILESGKGYACYFVRLRGYDSSKKLSIGTLEINNNKIYTNYSSQIFGQNSIIKNLVIDQNVINYFGATNGIPIDLTSGHGMTIDRVFCRGNIMINSPNSRQYNNIQATNYIEFVGNFLDNFSLNQGVNLTAADILYRDNYLVNGLGNIALTGRYFHTIFGNAHVITWGTAAPTSGTWAVGDYCKNSKPAVGQPKGWYCTVAGTPGIWTSEGNL